VASGEGYGANYLASTAKKVDGFDVSQEAVAHARAVYGDNSRVSFTRADIDGFFREAEPESYDLVTAFEVIEHVDEPSQLALLQGIHHVLSPGGIALVSSPDKQLYSDVTLSKNPFHVREMYRDEFEALLARVFPAVRMFEQLTYTGSAVFESGATRADLCEMAWTDLLRLKGRCQPGIRGGGEYLVAAVAKTSFETTIESAVMLDRARKLVGEEVYNKHVELEERKRSEREARAELEKRSSWIDPEEQRRREEMHQVVIDRLLGVVERNAAEIARFQRVEVERDLLQAQLDRARGELAIERAQHTELRGMVSMQLIQRAKRIWDRVPFVKNTVKAVVKKVI
jgi:SAM-dependent methyltransferase